MESDLWLRCQGQHHIGPLHETAWRMVETQDVMASRKLVDSLIEQFILEDMLESSKPFLARSLQDYHPLLYTPFRYPPLKHGSRFGKQFEHALWYGSLQVSTCMAEKAFYQFNFLRAVDADFGIVEVPLTAFSASIQTDQGIKLINQPFSNDTNLISSPVSYEASQTLGFNMRQAGMEAFNYYSARDTNQSINIALFTPKAFLHKKPNAKSFQSWLCIANNNLIEFIRTHSLTSESYSFPLKEFLIDGALPFPAS